MENSDLMDDEVIFSVSHDFKSSPTCLWVFPKVLLYILCGKMNHFKGAWHKTNNFRKVRSRENPAVILKNLSKIAILMLGEMAIISLQ